MSLLTDVFSAAYKELVTANPAFYTELYAEFFGYEWTPPVLGPQAAEWPAEFPSDALLTSGKLGIGVFVHEPFYYYEKDGKAVDPPEEGDGDPATRTGFEYRLCMEMIARIKGHYKEEFEVVWQELKFFAMPGDGTETFVLQEALDGNLGKYYDIVFSACFYYNEGSMCSRIPQVTVDSAHPDLRFFPSAMYTGMDDFGPPDLEGIDMNDPASFKHNLDQIALWFAKAAVKAGFKKDQGRYIQIWHTPSSAQEKAARELMDRINSYAGFTLAIECGQKVDIIKPAIYNRTTHVYVGDMLASQRMALESKTSDMPFYYLPLHLGGMDIGYLAPYTFAAEQVECPPQP